LPITDELWRELANARNDGNILPFPRIDVYAASLEGIPIAGAPRGCDDAGDLGKFSPPTVARTTTSCIGSPARLPPRAVRRP